MDKVWCCRTQGDGRNATYKYTFPVNRCSFCMGCKLVEDYPEDPRQDLKILREYQ